MPGYDSEEIKYQVQNPPIMLNPAPVRENPQSKMRQWKDQIKMQHGTIQVAITLQNEEMYIQAILDMKNLLVEIDSQCDDEQRLELHEFLDALPPFQ